VVLSIVRTAAPQRFSSKITMVSENENTPWSALGVSMISKIQEPARARLRDNFSQLEKEECEWVEANKRVSGQCLIGIDWKMRFLAGRIRESSMHHYGKRGLSWHEDVLWWYDWDTEEEKTVKCFMALDQIMGTGNKQDGVAVLCTMEALIEKINQEIPHLMEGIMKSDNVGCYHHKILILGIPLLNIHSKKFKVVTYIHSETQDGTFIFLFYI
jgi:hypothetical protein